MKKLLSVLFVMGLSFLLVACGDSSDERETDTTNAETEEVNKEEPAEVNDDGKELYEVGQTTVVERMNGIKYEVTPTKFEVLTNYKGKDIEEYISPPHPSDRIMVITYTVKNIGDDDLQPSFDTVIHFDPRDEFSGFVMDFENVEKAEEMLAPGEEIELEQYRVALIDEVDEFLGVFDYKEDGETWYRYPVSQEVKDSIGKTEEDKDESASEEESSKNEEAVEFGETATVEKFNGAKFEITIDNFEISNGNELVVNYTIKNVGETSLIPIDDAALNLGTEEDKGKSMPLSDPDKALEPLEPGKELELEYSYSSDDIDENKEYILRVAVDDLDGAETKLKTK